MKLDASPRVTQRWFKRLRKLGLSWSECEAQMRAVGVLPREVERYRAVVATTQDLPVRICIGAPAP